jgi:hypothetical protein
MRDGTLRRARESENGRAHSRGEKHRILRHIEQYGGRSADRRPQNRNCKQPCRQSRLGQQHDAKGENQGGARCDAEGRRSVRVRRQETGGRVYNQPIEHKYQAEPVPCSSANPKREGRRPERQRAKTQRLKEKRGRETVGCGIDRREIQAVIDNASPSPHGAQEPKHGAAVHPAFGERTGEGEDEREYPHHNLHRP